MDRKDLLSFIPLVTGVLIIIGFLRSVVFYNYFNIKINDFIGLNEVLILFLDEVFYFLIMLIPLIYSVVREYYNDKIDEKNGTSRFTDNIKPKVKNGLLTLTKVSYFLFLGLTFFLAFYTDNYTTRILSVSIILALISIFIFNRIRHNHFKAFDKYPSDNYFQVFFILLAFAGFICTNTAFDATLVDKGRYEGTRIVSNDTTYISTKETFYIGKTDRYVFIHDKLQDKSTAIPISEVKQLDIKIDKSSSMILGIKKAEVDTSNQKINTELQISPDTNQTLKTVIPISSPLYAQVMAQIRNGSNL